MTYLEAFLGTADYWVGDAVSHIDYLAFVYADELRAIFPETLARFAAIASFHERLAARPAMRTYIESGERPAVFGMGLFGPKIDPDSSIEPDTIFENPWTGRMRLDR